MYKHRDQEKKFDNMQRKDNKLRRAKHAESEQRNITVRGNILATKRDLKEKHQDLNIKFSAMEDKISLAR